MVKHPFGANIKKYVSGIDTTLDLSNIESSALLAANDLREVVSQSVYDALAAYIPDETNENDAIWTDALELLRYAMAPLTLYHHFIWLQVRISNNGITTYKSQDETTIFKYQADEGKESLLMQYNAFLKELIDFLETNSVVFTDWESSTQRTETQSLLLKNYREFHKSLAIDNNAAFYFRAIQLMQEITRDEIMPHIGEIAEDISVADKRKLQDILAYLTVSRACAEWDYCYLPTPIRKGLINEMSLKSGKETETAKERLAVKYRNKAESWLASIDNKANADKQAVDSPDEDIVIESYQPTCHDKHILMM